ncbi:DotG/IcmE/VirB10 family protein [Acinetobacter gyllenbergii]|uniref:DotG/IcmE/VirB10 family protein n=1 Tax=Acinetobacter gyllenbergii TaxID=134534 RepID=UPI003F55B26E
MTQDNQNPQSVPNHQDVDAGQTDHNNHEDQAQAGQVDSSHDVESYNPNDIRHNNADDRINMKFGEKFMKNWNENGVFRFMVIIGVFISLVLLIGIFKLFFSSSKTPDQIDASKTKFDAPETNVGQAEEVTPEQYQYIRQQEAILAQQAQQRGESFTPRNLVIRQSTGQGQAVLPATNNAANGVSTEQINATLFNSSQNLNYSGSQTQGQPISQNGQAPQGQVQTAQYSQQSQPQYVQLAPDYASPAAQQYVQNNNDFASWYEQESQRQISENEAAQTTLYGFVDKQIKRLSGDDQKNNGNKRTGYAVSTYAVENPISDTTIQPNSGNQLNSSNLISGGANSASGANLGTGKVLIPAGTRITARLLNDVNTDDGDQVFAEIMTGKLKGRKVIGNVRKTQDNIQFTVSRVLSNGVKPEFAIDATAQTLQGSFGMATHIDRHILKNSTAMIASSAAKGYGNAYRDYLGNTTYTNGAVIVNQQEPSNKRIMGNVVGQLGEDFGSKIDSIYGNKPTTFRTPVGTVFYLFINKDITE